MNSQPGDGERRAISGYRPQYLIGAALIIDNLKKRDLEWIRLADPEAGRVDDLQIATTARLDAYQVKWSQYGGTVTLSELTKGSDSKPSLIAQLASGWKRLRAQYPHRRVVVHLVTNKQPSTARLRTSHADSRTGPYHLAAFIEQAWLPASLSGNLDFEGPWASVWETLLNSSVLSPEDFPSFISDCMLDFGERLPEEHPDVNVLANLLFATVASPERIIELSRDEMLLRLGWEDRYRYRNLHDFPAPPFLYRPIRNSVGRIEVALSELTNGYIAVLGPPGSGKSTMLTQTFRSLPLRLVPYYAYVPESPIPIVLRGEATNFLHDVTLRLQEAGFGKVLRPDPADRLSLIQLLHNQLQELGNDYERTGTKTVILVDGLDHIAREQQPERSLLRDLPLPEEIPSGVYFVVGSQTDDLQDLPPRVRYAFQKPDRRIEIESLGPADVDAIIEEALPLPNIEQRQKVYELSGGHPLALIYLLKRLRQVKDDEARDLLLDETVPYEGDIEAQYWAHWRAIENERELLHALGLLARIRGPIPMIWVATWLDEGTLRKLQRLFVPYFYEEGESQWVFFHNSFRLFLESRTAEPLPGQTPDDLHRVYHQELARRYADSPPPWRWEALYHRYIAGEHNAVVMLATYEWFLEQIDGLRPLDAIQADARLALKAAGMCQDVVAIARLTLVGAALEQRSWALEDALLPDLFLDAGEPFKAAEHLRDGNRLRVGAEQVLRLSVRLAEAGLEIEGRRLFELAEPLELLSGRPIPDTHKRPQNLWDLLAEWVRSAVFFRKYDDVIETVQRIRIQPGRSENENEDQASLQLQKWLLLQGALVCCERDDWTGWQILCEVLDEYEDDRFGFYMLLRSAVRALDRDNVDRAKELLRKLLISFGPENFESADESRSIVEAYITVAELSLDLMSDESLSREWVARAPTIPLEDRNLPFDNEPSLGALRFRLAALKYVLGEEREPEVLLREAEAHTSFGDAIDDEDRVGYRQIALAIFHLARLWARGRLRFHYGSVAFLQQVGWIIDMVEEGWRARSASLRIEARASRSEILAFMVSAATEHGSDVLRALAEELASRWISPTSARDWPLYLQRQVSVQLAQEGVARSWVAEQLNRIEPNMLNGLDQYERVEACQEQAQAWLLLGESEAALAQLRKMAQVASGIRTEDDYQLSEWVVWLGRLNGLDSQGAEERIRHMLRRILAVRGSASGVVDASLELLGVFFRWSPRRAIILLSDLLEDHIIGHQSGVARILEEALGMKDPPLKEALNISVDLLIALVPGAEPELLERLVSSIGKRLGHKTGLDVARLLAHRVSIYAPYNERSEWHRGITAGLSAIGHKSATVIGLEPSDLEDQNTKSTTELDRNVHLRNGKSLSLSEVLDQVRTIGDLLALLMAEDKEHTGYFNWAEVTEYLAPQMTSVKDIRNTRDVLVSRWAGDWQKETQLSRTLSALSKRCLNLGDRKAAWELAEEGLHYTKPSGWDPYFDGGVKHEILRQLRAIDLDRANKRIVKLFAEDLSERFRSPSRILVHFSDVLALLAEEVPVADIWSEIEAYLDDLFSNLPVTQHPEMEVCFDTDIVTLGEDTPEFALADLILRYLDHPSYVVAQAAVRACTVALLDGSSSITGLLAGGMRGTNQLTERALMVLDAVSFRNPAAVDPFKDVLCELMASPNFISRLIACTVYMRLTGTSWKLEIVERETPAIYSLHLPRLAYYNTMESSGSLEGPIAVADPARTLGPLDIELREVANLTGLSEDAVFYRALQHFHSLESEGTWLNESRPLEWNRLSAFLYQVGLRFSTNKPHIRPARQALAYVIGELYDGKYFPQETVPRLSRILIRHDPAFILERPIRRPSYIEPIGSTPHDQTNFIRIPDDWISRASESLEFLKSRSSDDRIIVAEQTQLRYLDEDWPAEERITLIRGTLPEHIWNDFEPEKGNPPFYRVFKEQTANYLNINAPVDHLIISNNPHDFETPGGWWLALNPAVGHALNWQSVGGGWFRWVDQRGNIVVESIWWQDGPVQSYNPHLREEVGAGWLVLMTEKGFQQVTQWARNLCRGEVVSRRIGFYGEVDHGYATRVEAI
jgi:energy-coupling factor transporter ATP-binding protein EcfA2